MHPYLINALPGPSTWSGAFGDLSARFRRPLEPGSVPMRSPTTRGRSSATHRTARTVRRVTRSKTVWLVAARLVLLTVVVLLVHFGLEIGHGLTVAAVIVGAAWLLGRVD